ncbi:MAG TPA: nickel-dependent hydrogenase large subunit [Spirochaetota bacterium]|jgi:ferredoxin hydrogenase large subunit/hydrogenase large subunit|nr:nickel-dependent hydrogenase large subunit [Spirochaetota bacterium]HOK93783.1 nickel-dependent hydrogenase large subunit [Spirochaetota bacterium]HON17064.1 nickel-dependent hydrogenase large subunit [Spirochaetota bacterium]HPD79096.1 nickel-dependent hydrogenase large subunit [Spirochaetota bacterium]HPP96292.1 nickel-dependent hydrogenase large subunit [Spirochaetota bacterium]
MASQKVYIDPLTRIEGHLSIEMDVQDGKVVDAKCRGDMYRGYESILQGRNPVDAQQIVMRICGVCPVSHGQASSRCLDDAFGIKPTKNGRILRNLILGSNFLQSHILHFYHLAALDFVDITAILKYKGSDDGLLRLKDWVNNEIKVKKGRVDEISTAGPFLPRYEGENFYIKDVDINIDAIAGYVKALEIREKTHRMVALFGGRAPHPIALVPGGVTTEPTGARIKEFKKYLKEVEKFINETYINHVIAVAKAFPEYFKLGKYDNFLSYGVFDKDEDRKSFMFEQGVITAGKLEKFDSSKIREQIKYARYKSGSNLHPLKGETVADPEKSGAYSWVKAPRYDDKPMEVGVLARTLVAYLSGNKDVKAEVDSLLKVFNAELPAANSVLGRHAARALESKLIAKAIHKWLDDLDSDEKTRNSYVIPESGEGEGLIEAPRGALGHWIVVKDHKIANYQAIVPTTWFCSPRDDKGVRGPVEQALIGTPVSDPKNPIEAARVVRSFDPCLACAIHVVEGDREIGKFRVI